MIVVDASAMIEALVGSAVDEDFLATLSDDVHAPHLLDVEVLSVLRGLLLGRRLTAERAELARLDFHDLGIERHETSVLADRIWSLRHQYTAYDAGYLALAEALGVPLFTCDAKLASGGHSADVHLVGRSS
ncbi:MAG: type II toxin-antitoxin system VapC family toxin [Micrococcus sp.]|nr:type II toxin-antitoxin system VapC family toxin [Micrococcus sp.]